MRKIRIKDYLLTAILALATLTKIRGLVQGFINKTLTKATGY